MADKWLTDASWKSFAKGKSYKDGALLKALADVARAERDAPEAQIRTLEALHKHADALLKLYKGDKDLAGYLADMGKAVERARKAAEWLDKQAKEAAKAVLDNRLSFFAELFRTSWPKVTCPSPAITTFPSRRTQITVVDRMRCLIIVRNFSVARWTAQAMHP